MSMERLYHVLVAPRVTEKTVRASEKANQYVFKVAKTATKQEIKDAVETLFEVKVDQVRTINVKGKQKNFGRRSGHRNDWKKAYVSLSEGFSLDAAAE
ncbi:MAG: 50S ribosomal protein L23 [Candidatus Thiothrix putei]|uniref:Large ribosomal subunit protein uL23 n=2 Tax=Thiothrix TaxID=1030 RepID=A0A1H3VPZ6_9GAMM|nr:50S ribosomal protein L23 [Thiothrix caldifontis]WGZ93780.1 MAG: 50S ribosomal protein L23 [Candidatus Thiothrix putei]SDZ76751.1 large subunit ribosomal protein L23 [Thiothrix caldifontis]